MSKTELNQRAVLRVSRRSRLRAFACAVLAFGPLLAMYASKVSAEGATPSPAWRAGLPADFTHMPYANPHGPKGGRLVQGILGTFDSLNPLIRQGSRRAATSGALWSKA